MNYKNTHIMKCFVNKGGIITGNIGDAHGRKRALVFRKVQVSNVLSITLKPSILTKVTTYHLSFIITNRDNAHLPVYSA